MSGTLYFYDLETSGFNPRTDRIMQFAGWRTDMNLKAIGEPDNLLIKMTPDILPDPGAVLVTGITPQQTLADGVTEAEFVSYFLENVQLPGTIFVGYNNVRFDDEFIRFLLWRNFSDSYEWHWKNDRSRWDLLDAVRMTRALRPDGIKWPFASDGKPSNRLELVSAINNLEHANAHDALSDVNAAIDVARLIKSKQPKLFDYLLMMRDKNKVAALVGKGEPLVYTSGRYPSEHEKTTVAVMVGPHPDKQAALMYDLRINPDDFTELSAEELVKLWQLRGKDAPYFPIKVLSYNRCAAVAVKDVLNDESAKRLKLNKKLIEENWQKLQKSKDFGDKLARALELLQPTYQKELIPSEQNVDGSLYDGFVNDSDKTKMSAVRAAGAERIAGLHLDFSDERLGLLLPLYKARNFPKSLDEKESMAWEKFRESRLLGGGESSRLNTYFAKLDELAAMSDTTKQGRYLLEELKLYGESVAPLAFA